jgi:anti-sigma B factor antagonist
MDHYIQEHDGVVVVSPQGDLQAETIGSFQSQTDELLKTGIHYFVIDFSSVKFIDSSGLAALVRLYKRVRIGEGDIRLAEVPTAIMKILELTRLSRVFDIYPTVSEAVASMK